MQKFTTEAMFYQITVTHFDKDTILALKSKIEEVVKETHASVSVYEVEYKDGVNNRKRIRSK